MMLGNLYFIQEGLDGPIKIGWTQANPENRRAGMQTGNSSQLVLLGSIPVSPPCTEEKWHAQFPHCHKRGEWFYPTPELCAAIRDALVEGRPTAQPEIWVGAQAGGDDVRAWLSDAKLTMAEFAECVGVLPTSLLYSLRSPQNMRPRIAYRIEAVTGGAVKAEALLKWHRAWKRAHAANDEQALAAIGVLMPAKLTDQSREPTVA